MNPLRFLTAALPVALLVPALPNPPAASDPRLKREATAAVERRAAELIRLSDQVWEFAETALRETRSAALLAGYAEQQGFRVTRGVAGLPTAFLAEFGSGRPVIGILGEYDALPGLSQKTQPTREPLVAGSPGHGCGHNLLGAASLGAAAAIKDLPTGEKVFAGQRADGFFVDLGSIFDLGTLRPFQNLHLIPTAASDGVAMPNIMTPHTMRVMMRIGLIETAA